MPKPIALRVLTESGIAVEEQAVSIIAPGGLGYVGFLSNHAPLVTTIVPGKLTWRTPTGQTRTIRVGGGALEIRKNCCTLLTSVVSEQDATSKSAYGR